LVEFLPEHWLGFGPGQKNAVLVSLPPLNQGITPTGTSVVLASEFAEFH
jgi:hypothetical protein